MEAVTSFSFLQPENLPPTERAIYYHGLRVHLQVAQWMNLDLHCLNPTEWGWHLEDGYLQPIKTDVAPAPQRLLKFIRCNCKTASKNTCGSDSCSCRKSGLKCVTACGDCRGELCENTVKLDETVASDSDEDVGEDFDRNVFDLFA